MFNRHYIRAGFLAGAFGAATELAWQWANNLPFIRPPAAMTLAAVALAAWAFMFAAFWVYAAALRGMARGDRDGFTPLAALYATIAAPWIWWSVFRLLPAAKLAWLAALAAGVFLAPAAGALGAWFLRKPRVRWVLAAASALALLFVAGRARLENARGPAEPRVNVVLVTLDTTRADRLGCYGYAAARTPNLDRLAARGAKFDRVDCQIPLTAPSHASLFTSLYPETTGVLLNAMKLRRDVPTLSEQFRAAGYDTAAVVGSCVVSDKQTDLARGFDYYDDAMTPAEEYRPSPLVPRPVAAKLSFLARDDNQGERPADQVSAAAIRWLRGHRRRPFFLWLHYYDPHDDYVPPPPYLPAGVDGQPYARLLNKRWAAGTGGPRLPAFISALYDGEIAFVDHELGRFISALDSEGLTSRTVVAVVGDHGEALGEHGTKFHGFRLFREAVEVPLIICGPGVTPPPRPSDAGMVTPLDLAPTLLDLAGLRIPRGMRGRPLFRGGPAAAAAYATCFPEPLRYSPYNIGPLVSLTTADEKIIVHRDGAAEYFDLRADPGERRSLAAENPDRVAALRGRLENLRRTISRAPRAARDMDEDTINRLRTLGYLK